MGGGRVVAVGGAQYPETVVIGIGKQNPAYAALKPGQTHAAVPKATPPPPPPAASRVDLSCESAGVSREPGQAHEAVPKASAGTAPAADRRPLTASRPPARRRQDQRTSTRTHARARA